MHSTHGVTKPFGPHATLAAGPWSGSVKALQAIISGMPLVGAVILRCCPLIAPLGTDEGIRVGSISILQPNLVANVARQSGTSTCVVQSACFWCSLMRR